MICETSCHDSLYILEFITDITGNDSLKSGTNHFRFKLQGRRGVALRVVVVVVEVVVVLVALVILSLANLRLTDIKFI